jgi:hypothetical protein
MLPDIPLVLVEWDDAWIDGNEPVRLTEVANDHQPKVIVTLGWLLKEDDKGVSVAAEYYDDEDVFRGRTFIPRAMIRSLTPYKLSKPRRKKEAPQ